MVERTSWEKKNESDTIYQQKMNQNSGWKRNIKFISIFLFLNLDHRVNLMFSTSPDDLSRLDVKKAQKKNSPCDQKTFNETKLITVCPGKWLFLAAL